MKWLETYCSGRGPMNGPETAKEYRLINLVDTKLLAVKIKELAMALATRN
jgi:hypothetical protein